MASSKEEDGYGGGASSTWHQPEWKNVTRNGKDLPPNDKVRSSSEEVNHPVEQQQQSSMGLNLGLGNKRPASSSSPGSYDNYDDRKNNKGGSSSPAAATSSKKGRGSPQGIIPKCQVEGCTADLSTAKDYHRRHKVCEVHSKTPKNVVHGQDQRFCQQCSRFHLLPEFDEGKRSCRRRLAGHNERRRKPQPDALAAYSMGNLQAAYQRLGPSIIVDTHAYSRGSWGQLGHPQVLGKQLVDNLSAEKLLLLLQTNNRRNPAPGLITSGTSQSPDAPAVNNVDKKDHGILTLSSSGQGNHGNNLNMDSPSRALSLLSSEPTTMSSSGTASYEHHHRHQDYTTKNKNNVSECNNTTTDSSNKFLVRSSSSVAQDAIPIATASGKVYHHADGKVTAYDPQQMP